jgi:hypothetical protein
VAFDEPERYHSVGQETEGASRDPSPLREFLQRGGALGQVLEQSHLMRDEEVFGCHESAGGLKDRIRHPL